MVVDDRTPAYNNTIISYKALFEYAETFSTIINIHS